eukprot:Unigene11720_Nuclearia_a/m.35724 Unigene11720_Nuclearia_a/g.35724  ORF Unigene11720_Nuclearia_a/g.35724 Unigene11720_Nuclearia_a/m.35724 type:complete len:380 (+) Unigene11720_Nuclearia_a:979-2118(+)
MQRLCVAVVECRKVLFQNRHDLVVVLRQQQLRALDLEHGQAELEQEARALVQQAVDDARGRRQRHRVEVQAHEPRHGQRVQVYADLGQVAVQRRQLRLDKDLKHLLIGHGADHRLGVVLRHEALDERREQPEGAVFAQVEQEHAGDDVHRLAVAHDRVLPRVRHEHAPQRCQPDLGLERGVLGQAPVQVLVDLLDGQGLLVLVPGQKPAVVLGRRPVKDRARVAHPQRGPVQLRDAKNDHLAQVREGVDAPVHRKPVEERRPLDAALALVGELAGRQVWRKLGRAHAQAVFEDAVQLLLVVRLDHACASVGHAAAAHGARRRPRGRHARAARRVVDTAHATHDHIVDGLPCLERRERDLLRRARAQLERVLEEAERLAH